jgi:hypothetical protein
VPQRDGGAVEYFDCACVSGDWCQTWSGGQAHPLALLPREVRLEDIANALANQCRFAGHCRRPYSVAQHSLWVAARVAALTDDVDTILWGLMHDAGEAYLPDLPRPIKHAVRIHTPYGGKLTWSEAEDLVLAAVAEALGLVWPRPASMCAIVKQADNEALVYEARDVMAPPEVAWVSGEVSATGPELREMGREEVVRAFLREYGRLWSQQWSERSA